MKPSSLFTILTFKYKSTYFILSLFYFILNLSELILKFALQHQVNCYLDIFIGFSNNLLYFNLFIQESSRPRITHLQSLFSRYYLKTEYSVYKPSSYTIKSYSKNWLKSVLFFYISGNISLYSFK